MNAESPSQDVFFLERLDTFMDKCIADIRAFADRELKSYEETRRYVAEWHIRHLFDLNDSLDKSKATLHVASRVLEFLSDASGVQSFLLAVDPSSPTDKGFLGGSVAGREFWRGLRGGGDLGARSFKAHCQKQRNDENNGSVPHAEQSNQADVHAVKRGPAQTVKSDLYETVRNALRTASGIRNAEMRWTNPERLDVYGVRLVGWPESIPSQNPSALKASQNKQLLEALKDRSMRFERTASAEEESANAEVGQGQGSSVVDDENGEVDDDFSWAYDANGGAEHEPSNSDVAGGVSHHTSSSVREESREYNSSTDGHPSRKRRRLSSTESIPDN